MKKFSILLLALFAWVLGNCLLAPTDAAANYSWHFTIDKSLYGYLDQNKVGGGWASSACGPTAVVNSFIYLQNAYPMMYDAKLAYYRIDTGYGPYDIIEKLCGTDYMNTTKGQYGGTHPEYLAYGLETYIEENVGNTTYWAQSFWEWSYPQQITQPIWYKDDTIPTKNLLYWSLTVMADVEILIQGGANHYLTVNSFDWDDNNDNGKINLGECTIGYIDPNVGIWKSCNLWEQYDYVDNNWMWRMHTNHATDSWIATVVAERAYFIIPEPATMVLLGLGALGLLRKRRA